MKNAALSRLQGELPGLIKNQALLKPNEQKSFSVTLENLNSVGELYGGRKRILGSDRENTIHIMLISLGSGDRQKSLIRSALSQFDMGTGFCNMRGGRLFNICVSLLALLKVLLLHFGTFEDEISKSE